jgi:pullulanase/glycogen debranching enzyme
VVRALTALRAGTPALRAPRFPEPGPPGASEPVPGTGLAWFNPDGTYAAGQDWDNPQGHSFAVVFPGTGPAPSALVMFNAYWGELAFTVPAPPSGAWTVRLDTTQEDGTPAVARPLAAGAAVTVGPRSMVIATG